MDEIGGSVTADVLGLPVRRDDGEFVLCSISCTRAKLPLLPALSLFTVYNVLNVTPAFMTPAEQNIAYCQYKENNWYFTSHHISSHHYTARYLQARWTQGYK